MLPAAVAGVLLLPPAASAVKPGLNGNIAFTADRDGDREIYVMGSDGLGQTNITNDGAADRDPSWSPDDTASARIAFASDRNGGNFEIYTMSAAGEDLARLTDNPGTDGTPAWSPDGTQIAFASDRDGDYEIFVMNTDGSGLTQLTDNDWNVMSLPHQDIQPAWSPDGARIAYASNFNGDYEIQTMDADGSGQTQLTNAASGDDVEPSWSPNGDRIAFTSSRAGNDDVYRINTDGSRETPLTSNADVQQEPAWSPDGTQIAVSTNHTGNYEIYAIDSTDGSGAVNISNAAGGDSFPDGQPEAEPNTTIASGPASPTNSTSATFTFNSNEAGVNFQCRVDGGSWQSCSSPATQSGFGEGSHTAEVRSADAAGYVDATPASRAWTVDLTAPQTVISSGPSQSSSTSQATFQFAADDPGASFQCRLDAGAWESCTSPATITVADGHHTYEVRASDQLGNADATPASYSWTADSGAPQTTIVSGPADYTRLISATFEFQADEPNVGFECSLDGGEFAACSTPEPVSGLALGRHTFKVRAVDAAGNADPSPAERTWSVDRARPNVAVSIAARRASRKVLRIKRATLRQLTGTASDAEGIRKVKAGLRISRPFLPVGENRCRFLSLRTGRRIEHLCQRNLTQVSGTSSWSIHVPRAVTERLRTTEEYVLYVRATDLAGNNEFSRTRFMVVD